MSDSPESFVNRRGHKSAVDMTEEMAKFESAPKQNVGLTKPTRVKKSKKPLRGWQKKAIVTAIVFLIVLPLALGEFVRLSYDSSADSTRSDMAKLLNDKVSSAQKQDDLSSQTLLDMAGDLRSIRDRSCAGGLADNIAQIYPRSKDSLDKCLQVKGQVASLATPVQVMAEQLAYLEQLQPVLEVVTKPLEDRFAVISAQQENWKNTASRLDQIGPPSSFRANHEALVKQAKAIAELWTKLGQAYDAQDTSAFRSTESDMVKAYEDFRGYSAKFQSVISTTQLKITQAHRPF